VPLNDFLFRIKKAPSPDYPHCPGVVESVRHFLIECHSYRQARSRLTCTPRRTSHSLPHLHSDSRAITPLMRFIKASHRFDEQLGTIAVD
ncbi:hypothetical protein BXZ70DRAFT_903031, partial [Cristinia sonorae]